MRIGARARTSHGRVYTRAHARVCACARAKSAAKNCACTHVRVPARARSGSALKPDDSKTRVSRRNISNALIYLSLAVCVCPLRQPCVAQRNPIGDLPHPPSSPSPPSPDTRISILHANLNGRQLGFLLGYRWPIVHARARATRHTPHSLNVTTTTPVY